VPHDAITTPLVRILTDGCTRPGAYEWLYRDLEPRRQRWAKRGKCGDVSRKGGIILCEAHRNATGIFLFLPRSWQKTP
jgi:hypothetical protein